LMQDGMTPLHMAAEKGHTAIVDALLAAGAEVNIQSEVCTSLPPCARLSPCLPCVWARHGGGGGRGTRLIWRPLTGAGGGCVWGV
jgi:ankyrin repeat protein